VEFEQGAVADAIAIGGAGVAKYLGFFWRHLVFVTSYYLKVSGYRFFLSSLKLQMVSFQNTCTIFCNIWIWKKKDNGN